ncbi:MFS transporter [Arthrobacter sp. 24S4-2]|uniref:MFS transporter n=1 Tax=Arthrobacter sp. 24S4-2 TaxID=2575374 RepID=UPI001C30B187|nr:MFS transporter [Arthrobacter sp. 24S4-2]
MTFGANFSDGFALGIIGAVLPALTLQMGLDGFSEGMLASSALIGLFFGSLILGPVSDLIGRQRVYVINFALIAVVSALQFWAPNIETLIVLRLIIGFGLGADYAVGPTLLSEFAPRKQRGFMLASLTVLWTVGYVVANVMGAYIDFGPDTWRWLLASGALPALLVLIVRIGTPESPGWLISRGRVDEARAIVRRYLNADLNSTEYDVESHPLRYRELFGPGMRKRTAFGIIFFGALVLPYFAIYTFVPTILNSLKIEDYDLQNLIINLFLLAGGIVGLWYIQKMSRRTFTIWTFIILITSLVALGVLGDTSPLVVMIPFVIYTFVMSAGSNITQVYPPELYPTRLRASGVGLLNAASRIAAAIGTFVLPLTLDAWGIPGSMFWLAGVLLVGLIVTVLWAPETKTEHLV